jgi:hypothetical protein
MELYYFLNYRKRELQAQSTLFWTNLERTYNTEHIFTYIINKIQYLLSWLYFLLAIKSVFKSVVAVAFESAFHSEMYQNNFFIF